MKDYSPLALFAPVQNLSFLCAFASLADVAKGGDGAKSALREIFSVQVFPECVVPAGLDTAEQRWIDDQSSNRVDQVHINRREAADVFDIDGEIVAVGGRCFHQGVECCRVSGPIEHLEQLLILETVNDSEESVFGAGWHERIRTVGSRQAVSERFARGNSRFAIPTKDFTNGKADIEQQTDCR